MMNNVRELHNELMGIIEAQGMQRDVAAAILETVFCFCKCGTPLFVKHVTVFPPGYTKIYCPDCMEETEVFVPDSA